YLPRPPQNHRRSHRPAHRIAERRARGEGLSRRAARRKGFLRGRRTLAPERAQDADRHIANEPLRRHALGHRQRADDGVRRPEDEAPGRTVTMHRVNGLLEVEHVSFSYEAPKEVLHDISFVSQPGTVTAFVGPSGAGKSTIIGLIAAFYVPSSGTILVDGVDLSTVQLSSYRTQLGVVLQETFLFDGTIRENVAFSKPHATEEEVLAACRIARVDEFAESFEKKYDTVV